MLNFLTASASFASKSGLTLSTFDNTALAGTPTTTVVPGFSFDLTAPYGAAELTGTLTARPGDNYIFACDFGGAAFGALHVDDHLVCQFGANAGSCGPDGQPSPCNGTDNPLPTMARTALPVRLTVWTNGTAARVRVDASAKSGVALALGAELPPLEVRRRAMQAPLRDGWGAFYAMSYLDHVLLPLSARVTLALCEVGAQGKCVVEGRIDWPDPNALAAEIRLGPHAYDRSYNQLFIAAGGCNVSISGSGGDELLLLAEVVGANASGACEKLALVPVGATTWWRANKVTSDGATTLSFESYGLGTIDVRATRSADAGVPLPPQVAARPHLAFRLAPGARIGLSTAGLPLDAIAQKLGAARTRELASYARFGDLAEVKQAVQTAMMWQTVWNPLEAGPFAPVIRGNPWGLDKGVTSAEWAYVMFDWDNHFGSYMLSLDAKELGYSALIQVIKSKTAKGFVANVATSVNKEKHSQPPVGGKVLLEMHRRYNESWIVELLLDDLIDWNGWFERERKLPPLGITCLGSAEGSLQDARYESGLDDSPMYDAPPVTFANDKMQLYDVGMASMHAMDSAALAELAAAVGRDADAAKLRAAAASQRALIEAHLWDDASGIYVNKNATGSFVRRISPTSFYALQTGGPSDARADTMVRTWLLSPEHFCVAPDGDFAGNSPDCWWGLPSIARSDVAFPKLGYWRGYVWGPMALLTYWGLQQYDHVPIVRKGRRALVKQMRALMLEQWRSRGLICENFYPAKGAVPSGCSPGAMHMYHWGALTGFIGLLEADY